MKRPRFTLDTTLIIDYLRERPEALAFLKSVSGRPFLPSIVMAEVFAGIREGRERLAMQRIIAMCRIVPLTSDLAAAAGLIARQYRRSHGTGLADAIVAATAQHTDSRLVTGNLRHFPMLTNMLKPY